MKTDGQGDEFHYPFNEFTVTSYISRLSTKDYGQRMETPLLLQQQPFFHLIPYSLRCGASCDSSDTLA